MSSMIPFTQPKPEKQDNFTFRQKRAGLIVGRPTFSNKFSSLQPERSSHRRKPLPVFGSLRGPDMSLRCSRELTVNQHHYLKERGITLPRMYSGESSTDPGQKWTIGETDSCNSSDSETDYYGLWECNGLNSEVQVKSPNALKSAKMIYPWTLLESAKTFKETTENDTVNNQVPRSFKYGSLPTCYKTIPENEPVNTEQEPVTQSETKVFTLKFDCNRSQIQNNKRHTLERSNVATTKNHNDDKEETIQARSMRPSTLPRSSVRIRPILKNRIENIYTDLITSSTDEKKVKTVKLNVDISDLEEEHNYEQIRDEDLIKNWGGNAKTTDQIHLKRKNVQKTLKNHCYENYGYKPEEEKEKMKRGCDVAKDVPITLIL